MNGEKDDTDKRNAPVMDGAAEKINSIHNHNMLIVDDVALNHAIIEGIFEDIYSFLHAYNGNEAMDIIRANKDSISVILLDLFMPEKSGFEVLQDLQQDEELKAIPAVVVTAEDTPEYESWALNLGAIDLITTPFEPLIVKKRVANIVSRIELERLTVRNRMLEERSAADERYRIVQHLSKTIVCEYSVETGLFYYSKNMADQFAGEYPETVSLAQIWKNNGVFLPEDEQRLTRFLEDARLQKAEADSRSLLIKLFVKSGSCRWFRIVDKYYIGKDGKNPRTFLSINDVNADIEYQHRLSKNAEVIQLITENMNGGVKISDYDDSFSFHYVHENLCNLLGYTKKEFMEVTGGTAVGAIYPPDRETAVKIAVKMLALGDEYHCEYRIKKNDGSLLWVQDIGRKFMDTDGVIRINSIITDITPLKNANEALRFQAEFDSLTGLYNKETFYKKASLMLMRFSGVEYDILCMDIERFKVINDLYGINTGDRLLHYVGDKLKENTDAKIEVAGRISADVFAVCLPRGENNANDLIAIINNALMKFPLEFSITAVYGIYNVTDIDIPTNLMCDRALLALDTVKGNYFKRTAVFEESLRSHLIKEQQVVNEMNAAINNDEFVLYYQPQYDHTTGNICGAETLVRWIHPQRGMIAPYEFIPVFEKNGFITKLDEYVWERACKQIRQWLNEGRQVVPISVNISRMDIYNANLCDILSGLVSRYRVPFEYFRLEITETAYTEKPQQLIDVVNKLQQIGFTVEMDDFGSGYSSLNTLKDVPVDILKIDLKFLAGDDKTGRSGNLLNSIVRMAKWLDLGIIAEGVETKEQADFLTSIGGSIVQGYLYARPIPLAEFEKLMDESICEPSSCKTNATLFIDPNQFWNPSSQSSLVFNAFAGAAGVFELYDGNIETLRLNNEFFKEIGMSREEMDKYRISMNSLVGEDGRAKIISAVAKSSVNECAVSCLLTLSDAHTGKSCRVKARIQLLAESAERKVFFAALDNISDLTEKE